ncbi:hypothetical protein RRG08_012376 [Elysia crispata]|uniref:Uncharacterized protein n=1 Tax=Elysia crispata TaxID=231223 RepID=A0AAE0YGS5_9GAST|nr:hypothetical protein RRG08_012376 [Elysia crispata]
MREKVIGVCAGDVCVCVGEAKGNMREKVIGVCAGDGDGVCVCVCREAKGNMREKVIGVCAGDGEVNYDLITLILAPYNAIDAIHGSIMVLHDVSGITEVTVYRSLIVASSSLHRLSPISLSKGPEIQRMFTDPSMNDRTVGPSRRQGPTPPRVTSSPDQRPTGGHRTRTLRGVDKGRLGLATKENILLTSPETSHRDADTGEPWDIYQLIYLEKGKPNRDHHPRK